MNIYYMYMNIVILNIACASIACNNQISMNFEKLFKYTHMVTEIKYS